jgi:AraC-like DNA-binding protein
LNHLRIICLLNIDNYHLMAFKALNRVPKLILYYLKNHLMQPYNAQQIEEALHLNLDYIARCLKKHTGMSPIQYVQYHRIEKAKTLLLQTAETVPMIAEQVGITDYNYFIRLFRKQVGLTPGVYRRNKQSYV